MIGYFQYSISLGWGECGRVESKGRAQVQVVLRRTPLLPPLTRAVGFEVDSFDLKGLNSWNSWNNLKNLNELYDLKHLKRRKGT